MVQALSVLLAAMLAFASEAFADPQAAWKALAEGGHVALIRHGNAPPGYGGDPPGFKIDDCSTQRNLDEKGRAQARKIGEAFRAKRVRVDAVRSSPWCRCLETARLMEVGPVESSMQVASSEKSPDRLAALKEMISSWRGPGTLVLVTHAVTVNALFGFMPEQAEIVVAQPRPDSPLGPKFVASVRVPD